MLQPDQLDPEEIVVSCVFECHKAYAEETVLLYQSLDLVGGALARARRRAYCAGPLQPEVSRRLADLAVEVVVVEGILDEYPHANKIRMFEAYPGEKLLIALDTDIAFVGDPSTRLHADAIGVKAVDQNPLDMEQWDRLFEYFGVDTPNQRLRTHFNDQLSVPYFNTGVVLMPSAWVNDLAPLWEHYTRTIWESITDIGFGIDRHRFFTDQYAFAVALQSLRLPYEPLGLEYNFPTHHEIDNGFRPDVIRPLMVHHHHRWTTEDGVHMTRYDGANAAISDLNRKLASRRSDSAERSWAIFDDTSHRATVGHG